VAFFPCIPAAKPFAAAPGFIFPKQSPQQKADAFIICMADCNSSKKIVSRRRRITIPLEKLEKAVFILGVRQNRLLTTIQTHYGSGTGTPLFGCGGFRDGDNREERDFLVSELRINSALKMKAA
jgi:hypothetical protein